MATDFILPTAKHIKLNNATLQNVGHCCYNFNGIINRVNIDGIMLINLNDIISAKWMSTCLKNKELSPLSQILNPEWHLIASSEDGNPDFNVHMVASKLKEISNRNIELILYLDVSDQINHAYRTNPNDYVFLQFVINIGHIFAGIASTFNKYLTQQLSFSYITCIQKDGFQLRCANLKPFIVSFITSSVKYISKDFAKNIYLTGLKHQLNSKQMAHHSNSNILACLTSNYKFISMRHLYVLKTDKLPLNHEFNIYKTEVIILTKHIQTKKKEIIAAIKNVKAQAKQHIEKIIDINSSGANIIIGMNLDMEYDSQIYNGVQHILENLKYTPPSSEKKKPPHQLNPFANIFNNTGPSASASPIKKIEDDDSGVTVEFKLISIMDLLSDGAELNGSNSLFGLPNTQQKSVYVSYIPVTNIDTKQSSIDDLANKINVFDDVISKGTNKSVSGNKAIKTKKVFVLTGTNLTFDYFKKIIACIGNKKQGTNYTPFESKYINFDINPYLRCCMAYYNYMAAVNNITLNTTSTGIAEPFYIGNAKTYSRFYNYFTCIRGRCNDSKIVPSTLNSKPISTLDESRDRRIDVTPVALHWADDSMPVQTVHNTSVTPQAKTNLNIKNNCCTCCKCLSRFGTEYHEYKYIPYLDDKVIELLDSTTDIWIPRI